MNRVYLEMDVPIQLIQTNIHAILKDYPEGLSEYELIAELQQGANQCLGENVYESDLNMFQTHFLLFHCLYGLRDQLLVQAVADIDIHCLKIQLVSIQQIESDVPAKHDPLREYYLDLSQLQETTAGDVDALLNSFWRRYLAAEHHSDALEVLELEGRVSFEEIKEQYRRLVMQHHPDRGGDTARLQMINEAMETLKLYHQQA